MRFSLGTLILVVLWIAAGTAVIVQRSPWVPAASPLNLTMGERLVSPDGTRRVEPPHGFDLRVVDARDNRLLWIQNDSGLEAEFLDDDTIMIYGGLGHWSLHRRFPEWWWGHFYRVEVWVWLVLTVMLMWKGVVSRIDKEGALKQ